MVWNEHMSNLYAFFVGNEDFLGRWKGSIFEYGLRRMFALHAWGHSLRNIAADLLREIEFIALVCFFYVSRTIAFKMPYAVLPCFSRNTRAPSQNQICSAVHGRRREFLVFTAGTLEIPLGSASRDRNRRLCRGAIPRCDNLYECRKEREVTEWNKIEQSRIGIRWNKRE